MPREQLPPVDDILFEADFNGYSTGAITAATDDIAVVVANLTAETKDGNTYLKITADENKSNNNTNLILKNPGISYEDTPVIVIEADYLFGEDLTQTGYFCTQFRRYTTSETAKEWYELYSTFFSSMSIRPANKIVNCANQAIPKGSWCTVQTLVDLKNGLVAVSVNGILAQYTNEIKEVVIPANQLIIGKIGSGSNPVTEGSYCVDNVKIYKGSDRFSADFYSENFDKYAVDAEPSGSFTDFHVLNSKIVERQGSNKAWSVAYDPETYVSGTQNNQGDGNVSNINCQTKLTNQAVCYLQNEKILYEASYCFPEDAKGQIQTQFNGTAYLGETAESSSTVSFVDLYCINLEGDLPILKCASTKQSAYTATMNRGEWNTVSAVINLKTGSYDLYLNQLLVIPNAQLYGVSALTNITISANSVIIGKANSGSYGAGSYLLDDIRVSSKIPQSDIPGILDQEAFVNGLISTVNSASVRLKDPSGLRFASKIDDTKISELANLVESGQILSCKMGTLIAPADYVTEAGAFTKEALHTLSHEVNYLDVAFGGEYFTGSIGGNSDDGNYMVGSIVNIKSGNYNRDFCGIGYVEIALNGDQSPITIYSNGYCTRSIASVAAAAKADPSADFNDAELAILNRFAPDAQ